MTVDKIGKGGKHYAHFTPEAGADMLAAAIPDELLLKPGFMVLDLCAGSGSLVVAVIRRMLALGIDPEAIKSSVHAIELDPEYVEQCNRHITEYLGEGAYCIQGSVLDSKP